jgi:hypothetical protein
MIILPIIFCDEQAECGHLLLSFPKKEKAVLKIKK